MFQKKWYYYDKLQSIWKYKALQMSDGIRQTMVFKTSPIFDKLFLKWHQQFHIFAFLMSIFLYKTKIFLDGEHLIFIYVWSWFCCCKFTLIIFLKQNTDISNPRNCFERMIIVVSFAPFVPFVILQNDIIDFVSLLPKFYQNKGYVYIAY